MGSHKGHTHTHTQDSEPNQIEKQQLQEVPLLQHFSEPLT